MRESAQAAPCRAQGRTAGTASTSGNRTTYSDVQRRTVGTATVSDNTTIYRDARLATSSNCSADKATAAVELREFLPFRFIAGFANEKETWYIFRLK